jgi:transcriptional repressor NF-X1
MPCGKNLSCGRHTCIKSCHLGACEKPTDVCKQLCTVKRSECEHNCNAPCHEGACPEKACRMQVEVTCQCGNLKEIKSCEQVAYDNKKIQRVRLAMQMQEGGNVEMRDVYSGSEKRTLKVLECNDECKTLERNRRLEIAFKVENPNLLSYPKFVPNYTEFIKTFYKKESVFVNSVFDKLTELVKLAKESKQKSRSHSFPVMNRDKRHAVHDLAAMFGVETVAYDAEPNRNVVATASKESVSVSIEILRGAF